MIDYKGHLNLGNANIGAETTITANEDLRTADAGALAREISHLNALIPEQVAKSVLDNFCKAACELMAMGFAIQLKSGDDVAIRILPDIHVKGGNINLARARELDPTVTELTAENAGELIDKAGGVMVKVRAIVQQKFTDMLNDEDVKVQRKGIVTVPYVERTQCEGNIPPGGGSTPSGGDNTGGGGNPDTGDGDGD